MFAITVEDQPIFIKKGTIIKLEVNNTAFSVDKIEGDIVFTFEVPAFKNDIIFRHARFVYVQRLKKYRCSVLAAGTEIAHGELYIQKSTPQAYSCGLVINPFPINFQDHKLSENDYGADLEISSNNREHKSSFLNFLGQSLQENSIIKFPLFLDPSFYGSSNDDFGWYLLPSDNPTGENPSGIQASINTNDSIGLDKCYVNRLFSNYRGDVIEAFSATNRGVRIFNNEAVTNPNSFTFAPAINLLWIIQKVFETAGYSIIGNFMDEKNMRSIYSQSLRALDGLASQFEESEAKATVTIFPEVLFDQSHDSEDLELKYTTTDHLSAVYFIPPASGQYQFSVTIKTYLPANFLEEGTDPNEPGMTFKDALFFFLKDFSTPFPNHLEGYAHHDWNDGIGYMENGNYTRHPFYFKVHTLNQLQTQIGYTGAGFYTFQYTFWQHLTANKQYYFIFAKARGWTANDILLTGIFNYQPIPITSEIPNYYKVYNCYANRLKYAEHMPEIANSEFISSICNAFGLSMFMDSATRQIELSFFKDILATTQTLDLSSYVITNETCISKNEPKKYTFSLEPLKSEDIDEIKLLPPVLKFEDLPDALKNYGKICLVENENQYRIANRVGDSVQNWVFKWEPLSGNNQKMEIGEGDKEEIKPAFKIPCLKIADEKAHRKFLMLEIDAQGCSPVFNTGNKGFEMILVNYLGQKPLTFDAGSVYYECASPVHLDQYGVRSDGIDFTVDGLGKQYVQPWLNYLSSHEKITHKFIFNYSVFLQVLQLLKPQNKPVKEQIRKVLVDHIELLPVKMNFQFTEGSENILAEIEFAKEKIEL